MIRGTAAAARLATVGVLLGLSSAAQAQVFIETSTTAPFVPIALLPGITQLTDFAFSSRDEGRATLALPFSYRFIGTPYDEVEVTVNGQLVFGGGYVGSYSNQALGGTGNPNNMIAVWWDDLILPDAAGYSTHGVFGTAPNRVFVIEVRDWEHYGLANIADGRHQVWLYEGTPGRFEVRYDRTLTDTENYSATVGWEGPGGQPFGAFLPCGLGSPYCAAGDYASLTGRVFAVEQAPGPDLVGAIGDFGRGALAGQSVSVPVTLQNVGIAAASGVTSELYLSADGTLDVASDIRVATFATPQLDPGTSSQVTVPVTVPVSVPPGDYYLLLAVDVLDVAAEPDEQDNVAVAAGRFATAAELSAVAVSANGARPGQSMQVDLTVSNTGLPFAGPVEVALLASRDQVIDAGDIDLGRSTFILAGAVGDEQVSAQVTLPASIPPGGYYLFATLDPDRLVPQLTPLEDRVVSAARFPTAPDFVPVLVTGPPGATPGSQITFELTIENRGLDYAGLAQVRAIASTDPIYDLNDPVLGQASLDLTLAQGQSRVVAMQVTLPAIPSARYFPILLVDPDRAVPEVDEYNNSRVGAQAFATGPDLVVSNVEGPYELAPGEVGAFSVQIASIGSPYTGPMSFDVFLSSDDVFDAQDTLLGTATGSFASASDATVDVDFTMPAVPPGDYMIIARADPTGLVAEADESNNVYLDEDDIETGPDFYLYGVDIDPRQAAPGDVLEVSAVLRNYGTAYSGPVEMAVFLSEDYSYDPADTEVHRFFVDLQGGDYLAVTSTFALAADAPLGDFEVVVVANPGGTIPENDYYDGEDDGTYDLTIEGPNPTVTSLSGAPLAFTGRPYALELVLENTGPLPAVGVDVAIVLSGVGVLSEGEELVRTATTTLASGAQVTLQMLVDIPSDVPAGMYVFGTVVDPDGRIHETDERDNLYVLEGGLQVMAPSADLVGRIVQTATAAAPGEPIAVTRYVENTGIGDAPSFSVRYVLSADDTIDAWDLTVGTSTLALAEGQDDFQVEVFEVPETVPEGRYRLGMILDAYQAVGEIDETNNTALGPWIAVYAPGLRVATTTLPDAVLGAPYEATLFASGAVQEVGWSVVQGGLPPGVILDQITGELRGEPRQEGRYTFTVQVRSGGAVARRTLGLSVYAGTVPLRLATRRAPVGTVGRDYAGEVLAVGGRAPYRFAARSAMPLGLTFEPSGQVSGAPSLAGVTSVTVEVEDAVGARAEGIVTFEVLRADHQVRISQTLLPVGRVGEDYCDPSVIGLLASGGNPPYTWTVGTALPPGLTLDPDGTLCGVPEQAGTSEVLFRVSDASGSYDTALLELEVATSEAFVVRTRALPDAILGAPYEATLAAVGGTDPLTWSLDLGALPAGLSLGGDGSLFGTPTAVEGAAFVVLVRDAQGQARLQALSLRVVDPAQTGGGGCRCLGGQEADVWPLWGIGLTLILATRRRRRR